VKIGKDLEVSGRCLIVRYYPSIHLAGLGETSKNLSQDSRSPSRDLNPGPSEYETGVLITAFSCALYEATFSLFPGYVDWNSAPLKSTHIPGCQTVAVNCCLRHILNQRCLAEGDARVD
jgi:hypothetical protein